MSPANRTNPRRRSGVVSRDPCCPEVVTNATPAQEDSRADVADLADAVANLNRQVSSLQSMVMGSKSSCEATTTLQIPPEDSMRSSDTEDDVTKPNRNRAAQDTWWFEDTCSEPERPRVAPFVPSSWAQQMSTATQMEVFDGHPRKWPTFFANFLSLVHEVVPSDAQRLAILGQSLSPQLRSGFSGLLANPLMYRELLRRLHSLYGDPRTLAKTNLNYLLLLPPLRSEQNCDLETFFCNVSGPVTTMKLCCLVHDLKPVALLEHTASKLTPKLPERCLSHQRGLSFAPTVETFVDRLQTVLSERMLISWTSTVTGAPMIRERRKHTVRTTAVSEPPMTECCTCKNGRHRVAACPQFTDMSVRSRIEKAFGNGLCLRCLRKGHRQGDCSKAQRSSEEGCKAYHHQLLRGSPRLFGETNRIRKTENPSRERSDSVNVGFEASHRTENAIACAVVPVIVHGNGRSVRSFALLDSGSEVSILSERLARQANLSGRS
uniref:CCHC-type domain-containing protein n=1 Tax=Trichuris muris TaxID=70415 RepID=A0A5S6Q8G2_TRIMR